MPLGQIAMARIYDVAYSHSIGARFPPFRVSVRFFRNIVFVGPLDHFLAELLAPTRQPARRRHGIEIPALRNGRPTGTAHRNQRRVGPGAWESASSRDSDREYPLRRPYSGATDCKDRFNYFLLNGNRRARPSD